jgi:hypothetical protein
MLEAYCDESDSTTLGGEPVLVLAGYLADESEWRNLISAWEKEILDKYKIPYFHAKELRSRNAKFYRHLDFAARRDLLNTACSLIKHNVRAGAIVYMRPSDWKRETTQRQRSKWGSAYGVCMEMLLSPVLSKLVQGPERVSIFLEDGHANVSRFSLKWREGVFR